jgi:hypothetical protein
MAIFFCDTLISFSIWLLGYQFLLEESSATCIFILGSWNFRIFKMEMLDPWFVEKKPFW